MNDIYNNMEKTKRTENRISKVLNENAAIANNEKKSVHKSQIIFAKPFA